MGLLSFLFGSKKKLETSCKGEDVLTSYDIEELEDRVFDEALLHESLAYEKACLLTKEATRHKKNGEMELAVEKCRLAYETYPTPENCYKYASYLQLNKQNDEGWKVLADFINHIKGQLISETDPQTKWMLMSEIRSVEKDTCKFLKKEKRWEDYAFYRVVADFYELVMAHSLYNCDHPKFLTMLMNSSIAENVPKNAKNKVDYEKYDLKLRSIAEDNKGSLMLICEQFNSPSVYQLGWDSPEKKEAVQLMEKLFEAPFSTKYQS
jgi:uncharacterized small protein (DUF1192 family)